MWVPRGRDITCFSFSYTAADCYVSTLGPGVHWSGVGGIMAPAVQSLCKEPWFWALPTGGHCSGLKRHMTSQENEICPPLLALLSFPALFWLIFFSTWLMRKNKDERVWCLSKSPAWEARVGRQSTAGCFLAGVRWGQVKRANSLLAGTSHQSGQDLLLHPPGMPMACNILH